MSKVTAVTDAKGNITVLGHGHLSEAAFRKGGKAQGVAGGLRPGPGQQLHEIDLAEDVSAIADFGELHKKVKPHLKHP